MNAHTLTHRSHGFALIEVLMGIALLGIFLSASILTLASSRIGLERGGDRVRATAQARQALAGIASIREENFDTLLAAADGMPHGVDIDPVTGKWAFIGEQVTTTEGYMTRVWLDEYGPGWIRATAVTKWDHGVAGKGTVTIDQDFTDWRSEFSVGNWQDPILNGTYTAPVESIFTDVAVAGTTVFVTGLAPGPNLTVVDADDMDMLHQYISPTSAYAVAIKGNTMYVIVSDATTEILAYDIESLPPTAIAAADLPGSGRGRSLAIDGTTLLVGTTRDDTNMVHELYSFDISTPSVINAVGSMDIDGTVSAVKIQTARAYLAVANDVSDIAELQIVNVAEPDDLIPASFDGCDIGGDQDGLDVALIGDRVLLGRSTGTFEQFVMVDTDPSATACGGGANGPWGKFILSDARAVDNDPAGCYAFVALDNGDTLDSTKELSIIGIDTTILPEHAFYDVTYGTNVDGKGVFYDSSADRLFFLTTNQLLKFVPGSVTSTCINMVESSSSASSAVSSAAASSISSQAVSSAASSVISSAAASSAISSAASSAVSSAVSSSSNLIGYWKLDETTLGSVLDSSGNGNTGTHMNDPTISTTVAPTSFTNDRSLSFDNTNDYVDVGNVSFASTTYTVSAWYRFNVINGNCANVIVSNYNAAASQAKYDIRFNCQATGTSKLQIFYGNLSGYRWGNVVSGTPAAANTWFHVAWVNGGNTDAGQKVYINGVEQTLSFSNSGTPGIPASGYGKTAIGRGGDFHHATHYVDGFIDDVRIYDRALTLTEIKDLAGSAGLDPDLTGYWRLDETSGPTALDTSSFNHPGTYVNNPSPSAITAPTLFTNPQSLSFDGIDDSIDTNTAPTSFLSATTGTVAAWLRPTGTPVAGASFWNTENVIADNSNACFGIYRGTIGGLDRIWVANYDGDEDRIGVTYVNDEWTHIAYVHGGGTLYAYKNGSLVSSIPSGSIDASCSLATEELWFGDGFGAPYEGLLDDVRVYDRALTATEIGYLAGGQHVKADDKSDSIAYVGTVLADISRTPVPSPSDPFPSHE